MISVVGIELFLGDLYHESEPAAKQLVFCRSIAITPRTLTPKLLSCHKNSKSSPSQGCANSARPYWHALLSWHYRMFGLKTQNVDELH